MEAEQLTFTLDKSDAVKSERIKRTWREWRRAVDMRLCPVCHEEFLPNNRRQITCPNPRCQYEHEHPFAGPRLKPVGEEPNPCWHCHKLPTADTILAKEKDDYGGWWFRCVCSPQEAQPMTKVVCG